MTRAQIFVLDRHRPLTIADHVAGFLDAKARVLGGRAGQTIRAYRLDLARFVAQHGQISPEALTSVAIETYLRGMTRPDGLPVAPATANRSHATLCSFCSWLVDSGALAISPMKSVKKVRTAELEPGALSDEACVELLRRARRAGTREEALINLLLGTGARVGEALALDLGDLDLGGLVIVVRHGKGDKPRQLCMTQELRSVLKRHLKHHPDPHPLAPLFMSNRGRLSYPRAAALFKELTAGMTNPDGSALRLHQLRHSFATAQLAKGMNPVHLATLTGHADLRTLGRYTKAAQVAAAEADFRRHNR